MCDSDERKSASVAGLARQVVVDGIRAVAGLSRARGVAERGALGHVQGVVLVELVRPVGRVVVDVARVARCAERAYPGSTAEAGAKRPGRRWSRPCRTARPACWGFPRRSAHRSRPPLGCSWSGCWRRPRPGRDRSPRRWRCPRRCWTRAASCRRAGAVDPRVGRGREVGSRVRRCASGLARVGEGVGRGGSRRRGSQRPGRPGRRWRSPGSPGRRCSPRTRCRRCGWPLPGPASDRVCRPSRCRWSPRARSG